MSYIVPKFNKPTGFNKPVAFNRSTRFSKILNFGGAIDISVMAFLQFGLSIGESLLSPTQINALNALVISLKLNNYWDQFDALYPIVGGTAGWHSINLKNPTQYRMIANGTITNNANGTQGNGINGYWNTQYDVGQRISATETNANIHISAYSRTGATGFDYMWGATDFDQNTSLQPNHPDDGLIDVLGNDQIVLFPVPSPSTYGAAYFMTLSSESTAHQFYRNGVFESDGGSPNFVGTEPDVYFMATNDTTQGGAAGFSNRVYSFFSLGQGKIPGAADLDMTALYDIIQAYQTALGRQV